MKKKIVSIFVMTLLIATTIHAVENMNVCNDISGTTSVIDQSQEEGQGAHHITGGMWYAEAWQEFVPSMPKLQSIGIKICLVEPVESGLLLVKLKEGDYQGNELFGWDIGLYTISPNPEWLILHISPWDMPLILEPGQKYTIHVRGPSLADVIWYFADGDPYTNGLSSIGTCCDFTFRTYASENNPPNNPSCSYDRLTDELVVTATDPDGDQLRYGISWNNDYTVDQWTNLVPSGTQQSISRNGRTGTVGIIAEDECEAQSGWVSQNPKNKVTNINTQFFRFLENHPNLFPLLRQILGL